MLKAHDVPIINAREFSCHCGWYREVRIGLSANETYLHPLYGRISHLQGAEIDVKHHNCDTAITARNKLPWRATLRV